jgi:type VI secretion system Hcp family effector
MRARQIGLGAAIGIFALVAVSSPAFAPIYMKFDGIDGDVTAQGHQGWIDIESYQWGASRAGAAAAPMLRVSANPPTGQGAGMITFRKRIDKATPLLARSVASKQRLPRMTVELPAPAGQQGYYIYELEDVIVSSVTPGGQQGAVPMESISMNYSKITWRHMPQPQATQILRAPVTTAPARDPGY